MDQANNRCLMSASGAPEDFAGSFGSDQSVETSKPPEVFLPWSVNQTAEIAFAPLVSAMK